MRRSALITLLSLFLISGSGYAYADNHRGDRHDKGRKEQRFDKKGHNGKKDKHHDKKHDKKYDKKRPGRPPGNVGHIDYRPPKPPKHHSHPAPPPYRPKHYNHAYHYPNYSVHDNLGYMVSRITRGARDVNVWQVDPYTYMVRFRKGRRLYAQYIYPYEGRYGQRNTITVDWAPLSPWALIPSIHLNFNL